MELCFLFSSLVGQEKKILAAEIVEELQKNMTIFSGEPISVLDGVPVAIKDEIDCLPYPTTGSLIGNFFAKSPVFKSLNISLHCSKTHKNNVF